MIRLDVPSQENVRLSVYDVLGREVAVLVDEGVPPGRHRYVWDGRNQAGQVVASGLYVYRLEAGRYIKARKMLLVR